MTVSTRWRLAMFSAGSVLAAAVPTPGCNAGFDGPYPCDQGFASCTTPDQCETDLTSDPQNCSACNSTCAQGARCSDGGCTASPPMLSADVYPGPIAINSSDVFFWSAANTVIEGVPKGGGTPWPVSMQASGGADWPFAVDNSSVYYFAQNLSGTGGWYLAASPASPGDGSVSQPAIVGTLLTSQSVGMASAMVIFQGTIYSSWSSSGSYVVGSVPTSGGSLVDITSFPDSNGSLAVDGNGVYTVGVNNGPCEIDRAPLVGGSPSTLASGLDVCPSSLATDGVSLYFAGLVGTYDQNGNAVACALQVGSVPVTGGASVTVGSVVANEQPYQIAVDGSYAYVATNESLWKFPTSGGGTPTRMAGNLGVQVTSPTSDGCVYGNTGETRVVLALDESSAYLVVPSNLGTSGGVLLKIAK